MEKYLKYKQLYLNSLKNAQKNILEGGVREFVNVDEFTNPSKNLSDLVLLLSKQPLIVRFQNNANAIILIIPNAITTELEFLDVTNIYIQNTDSSSLGMNIFNKFSELIKDINVFQRQTKTPPIVMSILETFKTKIREIDDSLTLEVFMDTKQKFDGMLRRLSKKYELRDGKRNFKIYKKNFNIGIKYSMNMSKGKHEAQTVIDKAKKEAILLEKRTKIALEHLAEEEKEEVKHALDAFKSDMVNDINRNSLVEALETAEQIVREKKDNFISRISQRTDPVEREKAYQARLLKAQQSDPLVQKLLGESNMGNDSEKVGKQAALSSHTSSIKAGIHAENAQQSLNDVVTGISMGKNDLETMKIYVEDMEEYVAVMEAHVADMENYVTNMEELHNQVEELVQRAEKAAQSSSDSAAILTSQLLKGKKGF